MSRDTGYGIDLDRCRGTLVAHGDGALDCTDEACGLPDPVRHSLIIDCATVLGGCCIDPEVGEVARAS